MWLGRNGKDLILCDEVTEKKATDKTEYFFSGCPNCETDGYLMDLIEH